MMFIDRTKKRCMKLINHKRHVSMEERDAIKMDDFYRVFFDISVSRTTPMYALHSFDYPDEHEVSATLFDTVRYVHSHLCAYS